MHNLAAGIRGNRSSRTLWHSIYQAIENERCLDMHYRATRTKLRDDDPIPNYKIMKQLALRNRLGCLYRPFIVLAFFVIPILAVIHWLIALLIAATHADNVGSANLHIIPTTPLNADLLQNALSTEPDLRGRSRDLDILSLRRLSARIGLNGVLFCIATHIKLFFHILRSDSRRRSDLILHSRDALILIMLAHYSKNHPEHIFVTDSHYQRWSFVLSNYCEDFRIVQHGFLDPHILFLHPYGVLKCVYVRAPIFAEEFAIFYKVSRSQIYSPVKRLTSNPHSKTGVFLASSFPSIDEEIDLLRQVKAQRDVDFIIKFHPVHEYDSRKYVLASLATYVCSDVDYPACKIFVSHSSFMELDYQACGVDTVSIARSGGVTGAANAILSLLGQQ